VVSRATPSDRRTLKVSEAATFRDFYTLQHMAGPDRYALERALSDVEAAGLDAVRRLCDLTTAMKPSGVTERRRPSGAWSPVVRGAATSTWCSTTAWAVPCHQVAFARGSNGFSAMQDSRRSGFTTYGTRWRP
jgi:hypothetical protein